MTGRSELRQSRRAGSRIPPRREGQRAILRVYAARATWAGAAVLIAAVLVSYIPAMRGGYIWDDPRYVTENLLLRSAGGLARIWFDIGATIQYYPLVFTTFWAEYHLWKLNPIGYHVSNILLHGLNAVLLYAVLRRLSIRPAWLAAVLFALHPIQVESVAWITERKNVLSGSFYLGSLLSYLAFARLDKADKIGRGPARTYVLALVLFCCALLSKTVTCSLPAAILILVWWKRGRITGRDMVPLVPMFVAGVTMALVTSWMERTNVGAGGAEWNLSMAQRVVIAGRAFWFYLWKLVYPNPLIFNYPRWHIDAGDWANFLYPLAAAAVVVAAWLARKRVGRAPLTVVLLYGGTLFPALGFVDTYPMRYAFVADHFVYLACVAPLVFAADGLLALMRDRRIASPRAREGEPTARVPRRARAPLAYPLLGVVAIVLAMLTWRQGRIYEGEETLWRDTLAKNPSSFLAHNNLAAIFQNRGQGDQAIPHYKEALRLKPDFYEAHSSLGSVLVGQGRIDEARVHFTQALELKPTSKWAHNGLGIVRAEEGKTDEAIAYFRVALGIDPDFAEGHNNLGNALMSQGQSEEALLEYQAAVRSSPNWFQAHGNLANALAEKKRLDEAIEHYQVALRLNPDYAAGYVQLGIALAGEGRTEEAIQALREAARRRPGDPSSRYLLGEILSRLGQKNNAIQEYRAALQIDPQHGPSRQALNALLARPEGGPSR